MQFKVDILGTAMDMEMPIELILGTIPFNPKQCSDPPVKEADASMNTADAKVLPGVQNDDTSCTEDQTEESKEQDTSTSQHSPDGSLHDDEKSTNNLSATSPISAGNIDVRRKSSADTGEFH